MVEAISERVQRYVLDGNDQDLRRLLTIAQQAAEMPRAAFRRIGVGEGWNAIECGCGPIGALAVMAEFVGPGDRIVGVDFSEPAVRQAQAVVSSLGLANVQVVEGDVNDLDATLVGGPFDLAYTRLFLMHQPDPVHTLRRIAGLLRPGGYLIAQEPLRTPPPLSYPDIGALDAYWALLHALLGRAGVPSDAVENLPQYAQTAGFEVIGVHGQFAGMQPTVGFEVHENTIAAIRQRAVGAGVATAGQIDDLITRLHDAKPAEHLWVTSPFFFDLTLRKPLAH
jgi:SAM-dependent methyltransferase